MKLKRLYIEKYKNLSKFWVDFAVGDGLSILIGNNGSGKSNILEVISGVFHDLFASVPQRKISCDYSLEYELDGIHCKLVQKDRGLECYGPILMDRSRFIENCAPNNVIGLYSGEESRLWTMFFEVFYKSYIGRLSLHKHQDRMRLIFVNKYYWNISLLTLLLSDNVTLQKFVKNSLGIKSAATVIEMYFDFKYYDRCNGLLKAFIDRINPSHEVKVKYDCDGLKQSLSQDDFINDLEIFRCLTQAYMPKNQKIITEIIIQTNNGVTTEQMSEGEKKLILVMTVLEILSDEKTLILMDEPDAHLHEIRKEELYSIMGGYDNRQIIIASHSPTLIDIAKREQIIMLKANKNGDAKIYKSEKIEAIRELTGRRANVFIDKPILYCEGSDNSIESLLYPFLFPNYNVIPAGGHEEVINLTKTYNKTFRNKRHPAIGIIDLDYRTEEQLLKLKSNNIYSLRVVEAENVLLDLKLLEAAKESFRSDEKCIENVKRNLFKDCCKRKEYQAAKFTANNMASRIKSEISPDGGTINKFKARVKQVCSMAKITALYGDRLKYLSSLLKDARFAEIVQIYDFGHNINRFTDMLVDHYQDRIIRLIKDRDDLKRVLLEKYYSDIK